VGKAAHGFFGLARVRKVGDLVRHRRSWRPEIDDGRQTAPSQDGVDDRGAKPGRAARNEDRFAVVRGHDMPHSSAIENL
jgi:hypothetical protein